MTPSRPDRWLHRVLVAAARAALSKPKPRPLLTTQRAAIRAKAEQLRDELAADKLRKLQADLVAQRAGEDIAAEVRRRVEEARVAA